VTDKATKKRSNIDEAKLPKLAKEREPKREEPHRKTWVELKGQLFLSVMRDDGTACFAREYKGKVAFVDTVTDDGLHEWSPQVLPDRGGEPILVVGVPRVECLRTAPLLSAKELYAEITAHLLRYIDMPALDLEVSVYYVLFSWFYPKMNTTPYYRLLADTGKGKTRILTVVSDLCFYVVKAAGASTASGIMRFQEKWHGTLRMDEADLDYREDGPQNDLIKYLNLGIERGQYFLMTDKNDLKKQDIFDPFCPKTIAMRQPFKDNATEGRCLSFEPHETRRLDIPILLPDTYGQEVDDLRAKITRFVLHAWNDVDGSDMIDCQDLNIEPRLKQLTMPLSIVLQLLPDGESRFRKYLLRRQREIRRTRAESFEGFLFNTAYALAVGNEQPVDDFANYIDGETGLVTRVTAAMIAKRVNVTPTTVTRALKGIGFEGQHERISFVTNKGKEGEKTHTWTIRPLVVSDEAVWQEIVDRYYYDEENDKMPECPAALRGSHWIGPQQETLSKSDSVSSPAGTSGTSDTDPSTLSVSVPRVPDVPDTGESHHIHEKPSMHLSEDVVVSVITEDSRSRTEVSVRDEVTALGYTRQDFETVFKGMVKSGRLEKEGVSPIYYRMKQGAV